ncbi:hypothetical protein NC99_18470 [Sunxiuqinia dokdonensis]|uniref:Uncharacterized protein n=1 Tax=Sunxiuqinia dokdonensis TaxID=1409788 RepID=A0A0L8VA66_9BACT|nr:hypothetical protein NC99_18470 [Sunxiuqinia dokdonensis]
MYLLFYCGAKLVKTRISAHAYGKKKAEKKDFNRAKMVDTG